MSRAAKQLREYLQDRYPGIRISRYSCRNTSGGAVSQHSAKDRLEYDSNALDIMGADAALGYSYAQTQEFLDVVYADIMEYAEEWSIRLALWRVPDHHGHIHIDHYPTCLTRKWCGASAYDPLWQTSDGDTFISRDPDPENGEYHGPTYPPGGDLMPRKLFEKQIVALFAIGEEFKPGGTMTPYEAAQYWIDLIDDPDNPAWDDFYRAYERQMTKGTTV